MSQSASPTAQPLLDKHRVALDEAVAALATRGYYSRYPESPSPRVYGEGAADEGRLAFDAHLTKRYDRLAGQAGHEAGGAWVGDEVSPYGPALRVTYPSVDVDRLLAAAREAMYAWQAVGAEARAAVCLEIIDRINARTFELAYAVMHTSGQPFVMAFQAGGPHAQDRALEAVAAALAEQRRIPASVRWEKPGPRRADGDGEGQPHRRSRRRRGDRLQHLPDVERLPRPVRLARHRQRRRGQAPPPCGAAPGHHRRDRPGSIGRQRVRPGSGHAGRRGARRHPGHHPGRAPGRPDRRLHRRLGVRRVAGGRGRPAGPGGLHREGRGQLRRRRLDRRPGRAAGQPGLLVHALQRSDVHDAAERLPSARRHQHRRGPGELRRLRLPTGRGGAGTHGRRRQGRGAAGRDGQRRRARPVRLGGRAGGDRFGSRRAGLPSGRAPDVLRRGRPHPPPWLRWTWPTPPRSRSSGRSASARSRSWSAPTARSNRCRPSSPRCGRTAP